MQSPRMVIIGATPVNPPRSLRLREHGLVTAGLLDSSPVLSQGFRARHLVRMTMRACRVAALVLACALASAAASAAPANRRPAAPLPRQQPMTFYVVKGMSDAC